MYIPAARSTIVMSIKTDFYFMFFRIEALQGDSDHSPFYYYLGVPSFSPAYMYNPKVSSRRSLQAMLLACDQLHVSPSTISRQYIVTAYFVYDFMR